MERGLINLISEEEGRLLLGEGLYELRDSMIIIEMDFSDEGLKEVIEGLEIYFSIIPTQMINDFAEIQGLYNINLEEDVHDPHKAWITQTLSKNLSQLSAGMMELQTLKDRLSVETKVVLDGQNYFFLWLSLDRLAYYYETSFHLLRARRYLKEFEVDHRKDLQAMLDSWNWEIIRQTFKVLENAYGMGSNAPVNTSIH